MYHWPIAQIMKYIQIPDSIECLLNFVNVWSDLKYMQIILKICQSLVRFKVYADYVKSCCQNYFGTCQNVVQMIHVQTRVKSQNS